MIAHMLGRTRSDKPQDFIARLIRIIDHFAVMIPDDAPFVSAGVETSILKHLHGRRTRCLDHANVIKQDLTSVEQADNEFLPLRVRPDGTSNGNSTIAVSFPGRPTS